MQHVVDPDRHEVGPLDLSVASKRMAAYALVMNTRTIACSFWIGLAASFGSVHAEESSVVSVEEEAAVSNLVSNGDFSEGLAAWTTSKATIRGEAAVMSHDDRNPPVLLHPVDLPADTVLSFRAYVTNSGNYLFITDVEITPPETWVELQEGWNDLQWTNRTGNGIRIARDTGTADEVVIDDVAAYSEEATGK